eukprot:4720409-Pleurochrysis_carterae.AAC.2
MVHRFACARGEETDRVVRYASSRPLPGAYFVRTDTRVLKNVHGAAVAASYGRDAIGPDPVRRIARDWVENRLQVGCRLR